MFDFVRNTRGRRPRQPAPDPNGTPAQRVVRFHPKVMFAIVLVIFSLLIGVFILKQRASWDGKTQRGFLVVFGKNSDVQRSLGIVVVNGEQQSATVLSLPRSLELETLHGYGLYKSSSLYGLAALEKLPLTFVTQTISLQFGIDVSDIIWADTDNTYLSSSRLSSEFLSQIFLRDRSTFGMIDRYRMWQFFRGLRKDQFNSIDVSSSSIIKPVEEGTITGEARFQLDPTKLDPLVFELFSDESVRKENLAVSIVNTTGELRLGTRIARALSNMGVNVISVVSTNDALDTTQLLADEGSDLDSETSSLIQRVLLLKDAQVKRSPEKALEFRSDIVVMLGKDIAQLYAGAEK